MESETTKNPINSRTITIAAVIVIALSAIGYSVLSKKAVAPITTSTSTSASDAAMATTSVPATVTDATTASAHTYKDGTYSATGSYQSPGGDEKIGVTVTLANDVITATSVTPEPVSAEGKEYQAQFAAGYKTIVVGKDISSVSLSKVSGSSLTPIGFNDALTQIKAQAKA